MSGMDHGYTYDYESTELSADEHAAFGKLVRYTCMLDEQNKISCFLALIVRPQAASVQDFVSRQVERMWRTECRL